MKTRLVILALLGVSLLGFHACMDDTSKGITANHTAFDEQKHTEVNQERLNRVQPPPNITWSLERDNLIRRFRLMNDRATSFYMYVFIPGVADPVGYYLVNKVSSVDSQLTNTQQIVNAGTYNGHRDLHTLPSPAEDGSYGTNGVGVFGFTPEGVYLEHNMLYMCSTIPLTFQHPIVRLGIVNTAEAQRLVESTKKVMEKDE